MRLPSLRTTSLRTTSLRTRGLVAVLVVLLASTILFGHFRAGGERSGDAGSYLLAAHNLAWHQVFGEGVQPVATLGREPGYGLFLAALMRTTRLGEFRPECLASPGACPDAVYRPGQIANLGLALAASLLLGWTAWRLTGSPVAGFVALAYVALNAQMLKGRWELLSDYLALFLLSLLVAAVLQWQSAPRPRWAVLAGLAAAAVILTKAIFLHALLLAVLAWLVVRLVAPWRAPRGAGLLFAAALLPVGLWVLRNGITAGEWVLTDARSGIALSTREVFNHMSASDIACAFVFWTRGIGDSVAALLFAPEVWQPFRLEWPGGWYDVGQNRYPPWVARIASEQGIDAAAARRLVDAELVSAFLRHPLGWLASFPALVWRGIWIDEFIVIGLPALVAASVWAMRRGDPCWLVPLCLGWFSLLGYAAISLNVPRYQITAMPAIALASAWLAARVASTVGPVDPGRDLGRFAGDKGRQRGRLGEGIPPNPPSIFICGNAFASAVLRA